MNRAQDPLDDSAPGWLADGGEMGRRIRDFDWSQTPLGPVEGWSPTLRVMVGFLLANRFPLLLWWGPQYVSIYNDAYRPVLGIKHPLALGQPVSECWKEIWHVLQPLIDTPFHGGPATWNDDITLEINRHGFMEETHFTVAYSPVPDETVPSGIGGVLATVHEITGKVVGDHRVVALRDLGARSSEAKTAEEACAIAAEILAGHPKDIPFALLYLIDEDRQSAWLAGTAGAAASGPATVALEASDSPWPLAEAMRSETMQVVAGLTAKLDEVPSGPWSDPPHTAVVVPVPSNTAHRLAGFLVLGVSARLQFEDSYRDFFTLVASQVATSIANAREYEEEKKRAEALAEIDRAKTAFFSNVSHEFRTPLTLTLGPLEDLLAQGPVDLPPVARAQVEVAHRNSVRLLRLVNTLLDFSRIEAGRVRAVFQATDLAAFTRELASVFRAATERAGLRLSIDCPPLPEPVWVDREMWEKIVLNLLSNAFKFTFEGEIGVALRVAGTVVELRVNDTGVGVPAAEVPRLFERFHRVPNTRSRTHEGSGIGLALVQELARLHDGTVGAESLLGKGSTFIVSVPLGRAHLPQDRIKGGSTPVSASTGATPFVEEALRWLPDDARGKEPQVLPEGEGISGHGGSGDAHAGRARVLLADDNADMREYLARLLVECYEVEAFRDGEAALAAAREHRPDLVLSDVMMPRLDGLGLVREMRADQALKTVPIILLSARAGEESRVEGLQGGADDYLVKPFSARELMARVKAHLDMARLRKESEKAVRASEERFRALVEASSDVVYRMSRDWTEMSHLVGRDFIPDTKEPSHTWLQKYIPPDEQPRVMEVINKAIHAKSVFELEHRVLRVDGGVGWTFSRAIPVLDGEGEIIEWFGMASDVTERCQAVAALHEAKETAEQANQAKDKFIAALSHELRTPLTPVLFASSMHSESAGVPEELREDFAMIHRNITLEAQLIDDLLDISRIQQGKMHFDIRPVDVHEVIASTLAMVGAEVEEKKLVLHEMLRAAPAEVEADPARLGQVLWNLVKNAVKFTPPGGTITISTGRTGTSLQISVADTGVGIATEDLERIFQPFEQVDEERKSEHRSLGLGLAISAKIVAAHGGRLWAESPGPGLGATFHVRLG